VAVAVSMSGGLLFNQLPATLGNIVRGSMLTGAALYFTDKPVRVGPRRGSTMSQHQVTGAGSTEPRHIKPTRYNFRLCVLRFRFSVKAWMKKLLPYSKGTEIITWPGGLRHLEHFVSKATKVSLNG
jgi:hypothetical protein